MTAVRIRGEGPADSARIRQITELAFLAAAHNCQREHLLVDALRQAGALTISLVAESDAGIIGHVAVSPVEVAQGTGEWFGIGPISVLPQFQRQGIGSRLMAAALAQLRARGARGCVLVGDPAFYRRFGFRADAALVVPDVPPEVYLSLRFCPCADRGPVAFHAAFAEAMAGGSEASSAPPQG